jgi:hypothetical protein
VSNTRKIHKALKPQNSLLTTKKLETKNQKPTAKQPRQQQQAKGCSDSRNKKPEKSGRKKHSYSRGSTNNKLFPEAGTTATNTQVSK